MAVKSVIDHIRDHLERTRPLPMEQATASTDIINMVSELPSSPEIIPDPPAEELKLITEAGTVVGENYKQYMMLRGKKARADEVVEKLQDKVDEVKAEMEPYTEIGLLCELVPFLQLGRKKSTKLEFEIVGSDKLEYSHIRVHGHSLTHKVSQAVLHTIRKEIMRQIETLNKDLFE